MSVSEVAAPGTDVRFARRAPSPWKEPGHSVVHVNNVKHTLHHYPCRGHLRQVIKDSTRCVGHVENLNGLPFSPCIDHVADKADGGGPQRLQELALRVPECLRDATWFEECGGYVSVQGGLGGGGGGRRRGRAATLTTADPRSVWDPQRDLVL